MQSLKGKYVKLRLVVVWTHCIRETKDCARKDVQHLTQASKQSVIFQLHPPCRRTSMGVVSRIIPLDDFIVTPLSQKSTKT